LQVAQLHRLAPLSRESGDPFSDGNTLNDRDHRLGNSDVGAQPQLAFAEQMDRPGLTSEVTQHFTENPLRIVRGERRLNGWWKSGRHPQTRNTNGTRREVKSDALRRARIRSRRSSLQK
jgi:hypothetical protein